MEARAKAITNGVVVNTDDTVGRVSLLGWTIRATADVIINVRQGTATGLILGTIGLLDKQSQTVNFADDVRCEGDLYCEIVSGTAVGSLYYA